MVRVDLLPRIKTAEEFFNADKVLFIDLVDMSSASSKVRREALQSGAITLFGKVYGPIYLYGSAENLMLNATKGLSQRFGNNVVWYAFDGDLQTALDGDQIARFDQYYTEKKPVNFAYEGGFFEEFLTRHSKK